MFKDVDLSELTKYEIVSNIKKNKLDEFEGKVREIQEFPDDESRQNLLMSERETQLLDEGIL